jgi:hypothetical protein
MRFAAVLLLGLGLVVAFLESAPAGEKGKEVTLKGSMQCGKCSLAVTDKCTNVLVVKESGKDVNYFISDKGKKESYHSAICPAGKSVDATVSGVVSEKDGKKYIKASKVEVK